MDASEFFKLLDQGFLKSLNSFEITKVHVNLPTSVEFIVTSEAFGTMQLGARMDFISHVLKDTFGEDFYSHRMVGYAMTLSEKKSYDERIKNESDASTINSYDRSAGAQVTKLS